MRRWIVAYAAVWPILLNALYGARGVDRVLHDVARTSGVGAVRPARSSHAPRLAAEHRHGVRVSASIGLLVAVTAEFVSGDRRRRRVHAATGERVPAAGVVRGRRPRRLLRLHRQRRAARGRAPARVLEPARNDSLAVRYASSSVRRPVLGWVVFAAAVAIWEALARSGGSFLVPTASAVAERAWHDLADAGVPERRRGEPEAPRRRICDRGIGRRRRRGLDGLVASGQAGARAARRACAGDAGDRSRAGADRDPRRGRSDAHRGHRLRGRLPGARQQHGRRSSRVARAARDGVAAPHRASRADPPRRPSRRAAVDLRRPSRIALSIGLVMVVVSEFVGGGDGLGHYILVEQGAVQHTPRCMPGSSSSACSDSS